MSAPRMAAPPDVPYGADPWNAGPVCPDCAVPLVSAEDMNRPESTAGLPLGCPACGEGCDGTSEQIAAVVAAGKAYAEHASAQAERERAALLAASDAGRAVAALFVVTDIGDSRVQLAIPSLACGGWTAPTGERRAITGLRDELVAKILEAIKPSVDRRLEVLAEQRAEDLAADAIRARDSYRVALVTMTAERDELRAAARPVSKQLAMFHEDKIKPVTNAFGEALLAHPGPVPPPAATRSLPPLPQRYKVAIRNCKTCGKPGHNRRTCAVREPSPEDDVD